MKKTICWLLLAALLLGGCAKSASTGKEISNMDNPVQDGPVQIDPIRNEPTPGPSATENGSVPKIPAIEGYDSFATVFSAALIDGRNNKNLSPISVYLALAMTAEGAQGETLTELLALLGEEKLESLRQNAGNMMKTLQAKGRTGELILANSIWLGIQDGTVTFHEAYLKTLAVEYDAEANAVRFGEAETGKRIAAWIQKKTRDKIKVSEDAMQFDPVTLAVLINTIYLKDGWQTPFDKDRTEQGIFYGLNGKELPVNYMRRTDSDSSIVRGNGYLRYAMPLRDVGRMVFVLPDEGVSLESLLGGPEKIRELLYGGETVKADVNLKVPKFAFQDRTDLEETLMKLGVTRCFTDGADFSNMTDAPAHISRVLQESYIGVDENGVEAAAYTMVVMEKGSISMDKREKVDFHLTRPFLYVIESREGTVLFIGTVTEPDKAK